MKTEIPRILGRIVTLSFFTITIINACNESSFTTLKTKANTSINKLYQTMSTTQLQKEVEKRSINGDLPFEMGIELIKRWTKG